MSTAAPAVDARPDLGSQWLFVPEAAQWLSTSAGRLAADGYSWMQAVHWVAGSGLYDPRRHQPTGPRRFDATTVRVAQELAAFAQQCRPGIEFLMARCGLSRRSVSYHLRMLRETGLLARIAMGTRVAGGKGLASEYVLMVPPEFDAALGVRTVQRHETAPDYVRAVAGISSEAGRELMAKLAKKASRKIRKPAKRSPEAPGPVPAAGAGDPGTSAKADSSTGRCTPLEGRTSAFPTAGITHQPSEDDLASGQHTSHHPKKTKRGPRKRNRVGQRFALAGELMRRVPWLRAAARDRIAWVVGDVADAGWTADDVLACLDLRQEPPGGVKRASGFLAARLRGMATMPGWTTPQQRAVQVDHRNAIVDATRKNRIQQIRNQRERTENAWQAPRSAAVRQRVDQLLSGAFSPPPPVADAEDLPELAGPQDLTASELAEMRRAAAAELMSGETSLIRIALDAWGLAVAERIYGPGLVHRARLLDSTTSLTTYGIDRRHQ